jgi:hypothetical protein
LRQARPWLLQKGGKTAHLDIYVLKRGELPMLLFEVGFRHMEMFSDLRPGFDANADFYTYVAVK